jgi:hypothetical protein
MRKLFLFFLLSLIAVSWVKADEGMWLLKELNRESVARMKELGLPSRSIKLYDEKNASLKDAGDIRWRMFGRGGIGQGLIFTNHHCGYGAIQNELG